MAGLMDKLKGAAGTAKDKVDVMVDKAGEKMPPKVKQTYKKVSDKVEKVIPGKKDSDADEQAADAAGTVAADTVAPGSVTPKEAAAAAEDAASSAAMRTEGAADT
jgi:hypothetical protein